MAWVNAWIQTDAFRSYDGQKQTWKGYGGHFMISLGMALLFMVLWLAGSSTVMAAEDLRPVFYQANQYYEEGNFPKAIETYNRILAKGQASGNVYYNLGNTYYRAGQKGQALVNYLRARQWIPRDPDVRANLEHVQSELGLVAESQGLFTLLATGVGNIVNRREMAWMVSMVVTAVTVLIMFRLLLPQSKDHLQIPLTVMLVLLGVVLVGSVFSAIDGSRDLAVVVAKEVTARFEPTESGGEHFTLKEGNQAIIGATREGWVLLQRSDGKKGWVKAEEVEPLQLAKYR